VEKYYGHQPSMHIAVVITSCAVACFSLLVTALECALQNARSASFLLFMGRRQFPRRECPYAQNKQIFYCTFLKGLAAYKGGI